MPLTAHSAVTRRLVVSPGPVAQERPPVVASPAGVSAVLRAFGRAPEELPARTAVYLGAALLDPELGPRHEGFTVRAETSPGRALRLAHAHLHSGRTDLALVAGFGEPGPGTITVYEVKRAAEAIADSDHIVGLLDPAAVAATAPATDAVVDTVPLVPLRHGHRATDPDTARLLLWSGQDEQDEAQVRGELRSLLGGVHTDGYPVLPAILPCGTAPGPVRAAAVASAAQAADAVGRAKARAADRPRPVALLFPGQGSQHARMAAGLYRRDPVFTAAVDAALAHMGEEGPRIRADWLTTGEPSLPIDDVRRAQPLLFAVDYGLGRLLLSWGVRPAALLGHSAGELVAATLAGVVSLSDAVAMVMSRIREAARIPPGGMLAVAATEERLRPYLGGDVVIAAVNANQQVMLAGSAAPLADVEARLRADGLTVVAVPATSPFHSPAMAPACTGVEADYRGVPLREPRLALYSGYTGSLMRPQDALSPRFWARQITDPVYFKTALEELLAVDDMLLIEAGPRQVLTSFARRHRAVRLGASTVVPMLPARPGTEETDRASVLGAAAALWTEGHAPDVDALARLWTWSDRHSESAGVTVS